MPQRWIGIHRGLEKPSHGRWSDVFVFFVMGELDAEERSNVISSEQLFPRRPRTRRCMDLVRYISMCLSFQTARAPGGRRRFLLFADDKLAVTSNPAHTAAFHVRSFHIELLVSIQMAHRRVQSQLNAKKHSNVVSSDIRKPFFPDLG